MWLFVQLSGTPTATAVSFTLNGHPVEVHDDRGTSLLDALREQLQCRSVKDGCSPQGQCGCCTVWVDGGARVACVTPVRRVAGRSVTTVEGLNPELLIRGVLITMFDGRTKLAAEVLEEVHRYFPDRVFQTQIPRNIRLSEAPSYGKPAILFDVKSRGAQAYLSLAKELVPVPAARGIAP